MDAQWQSQTDQALNALRAQLARTRTLARGLAVVVVALAVWMVIGIVHEPTSIVLAGPDGSLTLEPDEISLRVGTSDTRIQLDGMWVDRNDGSNKLTAHVGGGELALMASPRSSTSSSALVDLSVFDRHAGLAMHVSPQTFDVDVGASRSEVVVAAAHDKDVTLSATPTSAKVTGLGATMFGLGDGYSGAPAKP